MYITNKTLPMKPSLDKVNNMRPVTIPIYIERQWEPVKLNIPPPPQLDNSTSCSWRERKKRIDDALSWLRTELSNLKIQDQQILGQFRRCQDTIEHLKIQKHSWHDDVSEDDLEEDEGHWEDWEITEFEREFDKSIRDCKDLEKQCLNLETDFEQRRLSPSSHSSTSSDKHSRYFHKYSESESSSGSSSYFRQDVEGFKRPYERDALGKISTPYPVCLDRDSLGRISSPYPVRLERDSLGRLSSASAPFPITHEKKPIITTSTASTYATFPAPFANLRRMPTVPSQCTSYYDQDSLGRMSAASSQYYTPSASTESLGWMSTPSSPCMTSPCATPVQRIPSPTVTPVYTDL